MAFENDMRYLAVCEAGTHGKPGLAATDDDGAGASHLFVLPEEMAGHALQHAPLRMRGLRR
jgi:hypothetical protein